MRDEWSTEPSTHGQSCTYVAMLTNVAVCMQLKSGCPECVCQIGERSTRTRGQNQVSLTDICLTHGEVMLNIYMLIT
jgi:hypothetical protein